MPRGSVRYSQIRWVTCRSSLQHPGPRSRRPQWRRLRSQPQLGCRPASRSAPIPSRPGGSASGPGSTLPSMRGTVASGPHAPASESVRPPVSVVAHPTNRKPAAMTAGHSPAKAARERTRGSSCLSGRSSPSRADRISILIGRGRLSRWCLTTWCRRAGWGHCLSLCCPILRRGAKGQWSTHRSEAPLGREVRRISIQRRQAHFGDGPADRRPPPFTEGRVDGLLASRRGADEPSAVGIGDLLGAGGHSPANAIDVELESTPSVRRREVMPLAGRREHVGISRDPHSRPNHITPCGEPVRGDRISRRAAGPGSGSGVPNVSRMSPAVWCQRFKTLCPSA